MRVGTIRWQGRERAAVRAGDGYVPVAAMNREIGVNWPETLGELLESTVWEEMAAWYRDGGRAAVARLPAVPTGQARPAPLYRHPPKIWGIGLNYRAHAADLSENVPQGEPAGFLKPDTAIIGPGDAIEIPARSDRTTAEAELGIVIGRRCRNVPRGDWLSVVAGFTPIIDMTAEDILRRNPRYLTRAKSFDTFFSFGPELVTPDEVGDVAALEIATVLNGRVRAADTVAHMTYPPDFLVAYLSDGMTLLPGDVISTGTPGAAAVAQGDRVTCRITGFEPLTNPVQGPGRG